MQRITYFMLGVLVASLLVRTRVAEAATQYLMFGSFNNLAKVLSVDTNGYVNVKIN